MLSGKYSPAKYAFEYFGHACAAHTPPLVRDDSQKSLQASDECMKAGFLLNLWRYRNILAGDFGPVQLRKVFEIVMILRISSPM